MRIGIAVYFFTTFCLLGCFSAAGSEGDGDHVALPWSEFKELLLTDKNEIVLSIDEYKNIVERIGPLDLRTPFLKEGNIVLSRGQFKSLLEQMRPLEVSELKPPNDYLLLEGNYSGKLTRESVSIQAELLVDILVKEGEQFTKIPLLPQHIALESVQLDGSTTLTTVENGKYTLITKETGRHRISLSFRLKTVLEGNPQHFSFPVPQTPITRIDVQFPVSELIVNILQAQYIDIKEEESSTKISAVLPPTNMIEVNWQKRIEESLRGPAKVYVESTSHIAIDEDTMRIQTTLSLEVLQNTISSMLLRLPDNCPVLDVSGDGVGDWRELKQEDRALLEVPFVYPKRDRFTITILAERIMSNQDTSFDFNGFEVIDAIREKGHLGIELKTSSEASISQADGLDRLDVSELPPLLINRSQKPLLYGFQYHHHPFHLTVDLVEHEELPTINTVIDAASAVTLFTEDGKCVHRVVYKVRNNAKQFMQLRLPEGSQVWSVFVANEPTRCSLNNQTILVPLNRSKKGASGLVGFDVELIYYQKNKPFSSWGVRRTDFPVPDILISQMTWSLYLPFGYSYPHFGGTVEKEKTGFDIARLLGFEGDDLQTRVALLNDNRQQSISPDIQRKQISQLKNSFNSNLALSDEQLAYQLDNEAQFGRRIQQAEQTNSPWTGMVPIHIKIPKSGHVYRFARSIINEEPLHVQYVFMSTSIWAIIALALALLVAMIVIYIYRKYLDTLNKGNKSQSEQQHESSQD